MDALPGVGNQRILTAILYLNDNFGDGETLFTRRAVQVRPRRGRLLFFANTEETGAADRLSEHAGLPVTQGEKWIVTRWIRGSLHLRNQALVRDEQHILSLSDRFVTNGLGQMALASPRRSANQHG